MTPCTGPQNIVCLLAPNYITMPMRYADEEGAEFLRTTLLLLQNKDARSRAQLDVFEAMIKLATGTDTEGESWTLRSVCDKLGIPEKDHDIYQPFCE